MSDRDADAEREAGRADGDDSDRLDAENRPEPADVEPLPVLSTDPFLWWWLEGDL